MKIEELGNVEGFIAKTVAVGVAAANRKLEAAVSESGGYPYSMDDVRMTLTLNEAGFVIRTGREAVTTSNWPRRPDGRVVDQLVHDSGEALAQCALGTCETIKLRCEQRNEAEAFRKAADNKAKAVEALKASGVEYVGLIAEGASEEARAAIKAAVEAECREANRKLSQAALGSDGLFRAHDMRMSVSVGADGLVVKSGRLFVMTVRFPSAHFGPAQLASPLMEGMLAQVAERVRGVCASRLAYVEASMAAQGNVAALEKRAETFRSFYRAVAAS